MKLTKNFSLSEFACNDGTPVPEKYYNNAQELANNLQVLRDYLDTALFINSGYRTPEWNAKQEGASSVSQHLTCSAADIRSNKYTPQQIHSAILKLIAEGKMKQGGVGLYKSFVHYDIRGKKARW